MFARKTTVTRTVNDLAWPLKNSPRDRLLASFDKADEGLRNSLRVTLHVRVRTPQHKELSYFIKLDATSFLFHKTLIEFSST